MAPKITFIRIDEAGKRTGLSRSSIYKLMALDLFIKPVPIIGNHIGFAEHLIDEYNEQILRGASREELKAWVLANSPPETRRNLRRKREPVPLPRIRRRA